MVEQHPFAARLATELSIPVHKVLATLLLKDEGSTVPFIARYRKERTGALDEVQIRDIFERVGVLQELEARRTQVLGILKEHNKLTPSLQAALEQAQTRAAIEDIYLPYRPKRRTRATIAKERGLAPLAARILAQEMDGDIGQQALAFVSAAKEVPDVQAALAGARDIVAEHVAEHAEVRALARARMQAEGILEASVVAAKADAGPTKFEQYYEFSENLRSLPSHRFLAIRRGEREGILRVRMILAPEPLVEAILPLLGHAPASPWADLLAASVADATTRLLLPSVETDVRVAKKAEADREAVDVFGGNLRNLLLAPPLGERAVIGIDPGLRTGCKCAAVSSTGAYLGTITLHISQSQEKKAQAEEAFVAFVKTYQPMCIAVGNGTGGREAMAFARQALKAAAVTGPQGPLPVVSVNEAGASVYSAGDIAREEFPDLDLTIRGAISIARRLQDPLAELVKIDPKAIGVGQYQHDVHQPLLGRKLEEVVESSVNHVGVELNTASAALLTHVAGIGASLAKRIVATRTAQGPFPSRAALMQVAGMGERTYQQAAGFLRIRDGQEPLDACAVHPERYAVVQAMAADLGQQTQQMLGRSDLRDKLDLQRYMGEDIGQPTLLDILNELSKPGRDPRAHFEPIAFNEDVHALRDLQVGMILTGVITNVTAFGAFVDVGVHQDGLVHISELAERFVADPHEVAKVGQKLQVRVLEVDEPRKRIALSARLKEASARGPGREGRAKVEASGRGPQDRPSRPHAERRPQQHGGHRPPARPSQGLVNNPFAKLRPL